MMPHETEREGEREMERVRERKRERDALLKAVCTPLSIPFATFSSLMHLRPAAQKLKV
jgi:hypothetical protein